MGTVPVGNGIKEKACFVKRGRASSYQPIGEGPVGTGPTVEMDLKNALVR